MKFFRPLIRGQKRKRKKKYSKAVPSIEDRRPFSVSTLQQQKANPLTEMANVNAQSASGPTAGPISRADRFLNVAKTLQFVWFCGHAFTLVCSLIYLATFCPKVYRAAYFGVLESFGIITYQQYYLKQGTLKDRSLSPAALLLNDDLLYFGMAIFWFLTPRFSLSLAPYAAFSLFHVLIYGKSVLLPQVFGMGSENARVAKISDFIRHYNEKCMYWVGSIELFTWVWLSLRALFFCKRSWILWLAYSFFLKVRFENSRYVKSAFAQWRVRLDGVVSHSSVPPFVKQWYHRFEVLLLQVSRYRLSKTSTPVEESSDRPHYQ